MAYINTRHPIVSEAAGLAVRSLGQIVMAALRGIRPDPSNRERSEMDRALAELRGLEDYQLGDMGLCRSDLTPEGLATAGARRSARQRALDAEIAELEES